tara:strand:- start:1195 stop:1440 length:246 start_codon:yes stop_codon:yes gene_type:complete
MTDATWILTKLGNTGMPVICSSEHPDRTSEKYDVRIGQACFSKNFINGKLVNISESIELSKGFPVFAFKEYLYDQGMEIPV